ncbi:MAG: flagellar hook-basal body complex protein [Proteobacteria bacterium]|nr:flagellar hook-basal body complex protein [Pseudomonadota bacterium]
MASVPVSNSARITLCSSSSRGEIELTGTGVPVIPAEIVLASFNGDGGLAKSDGGAFRATTESGPAIIGALGSVVGSALEGSNTDIADEFTKLIVTQQAYAANTRIISTADEMVTEALNMIR